MREGRRYRGLLIGNATFPRDPHAFPDLHGPLVDITQLKQALTDDRVGLFGTDDIQELPNHGIQDIRERVDELFTTATREDVLLLYYSGHGQLDALGALYLCAKDTSTSRLRATALSANEINNMIDGSAATTTIVILDCCYSGVYKGTTRSAPTAGKGRYVLTSSRSTQPALAATRPDQPSPFTGLLVRGLHHAEATGHLTVVELYRQVHRWMTQDAVITPQLRIAGEGDVAIARRPTLTAPPASIESREGGPAPRSGRADSLVEESVPAAGGRGVPGEAGLSEPQAPMGDVPEAEAGPSEKDMVCPPPSSLGDVSQPAEAADRWRGRRLGVLAVLSAVVVIGTITALTVLQHHPPSPSREQHSPSPSPSTSRSAAPSPSASATLASSSASAKAQPVHTGAGSSPAAEGGSSYGSSGSGSSKGSEQTSGSSVANTRSGNGTSSAGSRSTVPSGYFRLMNVSYGECLEGGNGVGFGTCTDSPATSWTYKNLSNGTFEIINAQTGQCMSADMGGSPSMSDCTGGSPQAWSNSSGSSLQSMYNNTCLGEMGGWPIMETCGTGGTQWTKE